MTRLDLRGRWRRVAGGECANAYPVQMEFDETQFRGTKDRSTQGFIWWDVGGYRVESDDVVMIQTATDAQVRYRYRVMGQRVTFTDDAGCEFTYEREDRPAGG